MLWIRIYIRGKYFSGRSRQTEGHLSLEGTSKDLIVINKGTRWAHKRIRNKSWLHDPGFSAKNYLCWLLSNNNHLKVKRSLIKLTVENIIWECRALDKTSQYFLEWTFMHYFLSFVVNVIMTYVQRQET